MHAPIILHIIYITVDNNIMYHQYLFTVVVNMVISSFHLYCKSLFTENDHGCDIWGMFAAN